MIKTGECAVCRTTVEIYRAGGTWSSFYTCPVCGRFELYDLDAFQNEAGNRLAPYLLYHRFRNEGAIEYRYNTPLDKEICDKYNSEFNEGKNTHGRPVHMDVDIISAWYPKTFSERIDLILLYMHNRIPHVGQFVSLGMQEVFSMLFVDRMERKQSEIQQNSYSWIWRNEIDCEDEANYMLDYLQKTQYIEYRDGVNEEDWIELRLTPEGYARIDMLQKNTKDGRNVLVAMKFGEDTKLLREAIRKGISDAGYFAIFIDEVQHNDFITPELLKYIRDSKFVVVDLTHQNNGAYFEEGYAMGLGKPVIQLCQRDAKLHFDIAQKNTIMWDVEESIPLMLKNRIIATID